MSRILVWGAVLLVPLPAAWSQDGKKDDKSKSADAGAAFSAAQEDFQKFYVPALNKLNMEYPKAGTDEAKDKMMATFSKEMDGFADRFAKIGKEYPDENAGKQAAQLAKQIRAILPSIKGQVMVRAGTALRTQYEKAYQAKAKDADELYQKARTFFAEGAKKYAGEKALATQFKDGLFLLEHLSIGKVAPEIEAEDLDGKKFKLSDYRGKVVVLDFWGNW
jgi:hypothetical protein